MRNLLLTLCYDGAGYHGWQIQENALAVQQVLQEAIAKVLGDAPDIKGCSRTDTGVHAHQFCVSMKTEHPIPCQRLQAALNHFLPADMAVLSCREVPLSFHARYSCRGKEYEYRIWNHPVRSPFLRDRALHYWYPLDLQKMNRAAAYFVGVPRLFVVLYHRYPGEGRYDPHAHGILVAARRRFGAVHRGGGRLFV